MNIRYSNMCYFKASIMQNAISAYLSTLVSRIKSIEGYKDDMSVLFTDGREELLNFNDDTLSYNSAEQNVYDFMNLYPYYHYNLFQCNYKAYLENLINFKPKYASLDSLKSKKVILDMPSYPNDGSIKIIDGVIVVKSDSHISPTLPEFNYSKFY